MKTDEWKRAKFRLAALGTYTLALLLDGVTTMLMRERHRNSPFNPYHLLQHAKTLHPAYRVHLHVSYDPHNKQRFLHRQHQPISICSGDVMYFL
jgi:hypothetical protein